MRTEPGNSLRDVLLKAVAFPALLGLLMFVGLLVEKPDHGLEAISSALIFSFVFAALGSTPFLFFAWLRWQTSKSGSALREFEQPVKQSNLRRGQRR